MWDKRRACAYRARFAAFDVAFFFKIGYLPRYAAFVHADVLCKRILRHTWILAYCEDVAVVAGAKLRPLELVRTINSFAAAENIYFSHKCWHRLLLFEKTVATATVAFATILAQYIKNVNKGIDIFVLQV